jgi:hypothetical protein
MSGSKIINHEELVPQYIFKQNFEASFHRHIDTSQCTINIIENINMLITNIKIAIYQTTQQHIPDHNPNFNLSSH